jgi:hypothetical protein
VAPRAAAEGCGRRRWLRRLPAASARHSPGPMRPITSDPARPTPRSRPCRG